MSAKTIKIKITKNYKNNNYKLKLRKRRLEHFLSTNFKISHT